MKIKDLRAMNDVDLVKKITESKKELNIVNHIV